MIFVGDDWAEAHHDVYLMDEAGKRLASRRLPEGLAGIRQLHELIAGHVEEPDQVVVGIETDRGGWLAEMDLQLRGFNYHGDVHRCTGTATAKGEGPAETVSLEVFATNQRDEATTKGTAKILMPSKQTGAVVVPVPDEALRMRGAQVVSRMSGKVGEEMRRLHGE